jgi:DNA-binding beta-propeller fold protein YncE
MMRRIVGFGLVVLMGVFALAQAEGYRVRTVDFLGEMGLEVNGAGPLLVRMDAERGRVVLVNTNTSSVSLIDSGSHKVRNIPIRTRIPQYVKEEALAIDPVSGNIYIVGNRCLHVVRPEAGTSVMIPTKGQYEMVAVNPANGNAFLVGRETMMLAVVSLKRQRVKYVRWVDWKRKMVNLNQTPPPPNRKVVWDAGLKRGYAMDGPSASLVTFSSSGRIVKRRKLPVEGGEDTRWHFAGYNGDTHHMYVVRETGKRKVTSALEIDVAKGKDRVVTLPELSEAVGIRYNPKLDEVYIPYDNDPTVHVVSFEGAGEVFEIKIPTYGNDATAIDYRRDLLFVASWAYAEVEVIDLKKRRLVKRIRDLGILPHMFNMAFDPATDRLIIPIGATAVNGSFGAALTFVNPENKEVEKVYTGWAPVDLVEKKDGTGFYVFNSEDQAAVVDEAGKVSFVDLPCMFPNQALADGDGNVFLSYGPHQSYWPVVYIWGAKNGILGIYDGMKEFYDRRIPRMAQAMVLDKNGALAALQNNWGKEKQFLISFPDEMRAPNLGDMRMELDDEVIRETTQRILKYDEERHLYYVVRVGETDDEPGILQVVDPVAKKVVQRLEVGRTPVDLVFDREYIYVANFDDHSITKISQADYSSTTLPAGKMPLRLAVVDKGVLVMNHGDSTLRLLQGEGRTFEIPFRGQPDQMAIVNGKAILTMHTPNALRVVAFDVEKKEFTLVHSHEYPFGETTFDTDNTAFYMRGQFADNIFALNRIVEDGDGRVWISDYLAGKLFIIEK